MADILFFFIFFFQIKSDLSYESYAMQTIHKMSSLILPGKKIKISAAVVISTVRVKPNSV